ncbi:MAG: T9SS type A sorting domain-containing protein [Bacteroidota bacterium]
MKIPLRVILLLISFHLLDCDVLFAQQAPSFPPSTDFQSLQRKFNTWKSDTKPDQRRQWKSFKRWEWETQLHTDFSGNTQKTADYLSTLQRLAEEKQTNRQARSTGIWYPVGPYDLPQNLTGYMQNGMGRVNCMAFHPTDSNTWFVGVAQGGLWKTTDYGSSYVPLTDQLPITRISDIAIDPQQPDVIYISLCDFEYIGFGLFTNGRKRHTHYGLGVYKSTDGGQSWTQTGLNFQMTDGDGSLIRKILIDPSNTSTLLACGVSGLYRSVDGGTSWSHPLDSLFWDLVQDPSDPNIVYATGGWVRNSNTGYAAIYKSTDFGLTWSMLNAGIPTQGSVQRICLAIAPTQTDRIYALAVDSISGLYGIYRSDDAGTNWSRTGDTLNILSGGDGTSSGGQGTYDVCLLVDPSDPDKLYAGGVNLWMSADGGDTFDPASHWTTFYGPSVHADLHKLQHNPLDGKFYLSTDGGIYRTSEILSDNWNNLQNGTLLPTVWTDLSNGMNVTSFYRISSSKNVNGELLAGAQDNATFYYNGSSWSTIYGGDGMDNCMDTAASGAFFVSSQYGNFDQSFDGGVSYMNINPNVNGENAEWVAPITADPVNYQTYYCGFENVIQTTDNGASWNSISSFPFPGTYGSELSSIAVSAANSNVIYATRRVRHEYNQPGTIFRTANGGTSWSDITAGVPDSAYFTWIEADPSDAAKAYVSLAGLEPGLKVFMTANGGSSWTNISYNLPNFPVNCIRVLPGSNDLVIASDAGVWQLDAGTTQWNAVDLGLPNVIVSDIEFNVALNKIYVSTFGRGIWASDLSVISGVSEAGSTTVPVGILPNPNNGSFVIELENNGSAEIEILDVEGRVVHRARQHGKSMRISTDLKAGLYFLVVRQEGRLGVQRLIVE